MPITAANDKRRTLLGGFLLAIVTLGLYLPATGYDFVSFDDQLYVYDNPWVTSGLSWATIKWAFTTNFAANWHPLTWISHLMDYTLYGPVPAGHHLTSILLHTLNTVLLFLLLRRLTGSLWPAALVAALFGWHPLHVESVAWISERKDVLCTLFWLLTIAAYAKYAAATKVRDSKSKIHYGMALVCFALGLLCKPMVVTLPFVLLLLDYWPLGPAREKSPASPGERPWFRRLVDKLPFFALSIAFCGVTVVAQRSGAAIKSFDQVSLLARVTNIPIAYLAYIQKTLWPVNLCGFYPLSRQSHIAGAICALLALMAISVLTLHWRSRRPWLMVGWLWFLGTLVPVIGLVQVGGQAFADRYTYIPSIGLFIMFAWSVGELAAWRPQSRKWVYRFAGVCLAGCVLVSEAQLATWRDSVALFTRMLAAGGNGYLAQNGLGTALSVAGRVDEAIPHYREALRLEPNSVHARYNLGIELAKAGKLDEASDLFFEAIRLEPKSEQLHNNAGVILAQQGKTAAALEQFRQAIQLNPIYPKPYLNAAKASEKLGDFGEAVTNYVKAIQLKPDSPQALDSYARLLAGCPDAVQRNPELAVKLAARANDLTRSEAPEYLSTLALAYASAARYSNAVTTAELAQGKAQAAGLKDLAAKIAGELAGYRASLGTALKSGIGPGATNK